jgi:dimethylamine monooxygenase subunit A
MSIRYFPFSGEPYKPSMGIKPLDLSQWIETDDLLSKQLQLKKDLVEQHYETVIQQFPSADAAILEAEDLLTQHLAKTFPTSYQLEGKTFKVLGKEFTLDQDAKAAIKRIAQYTQEDFCWLSAKSPVRLEAGTVCFPSRWKVVDKIGKDSAGIHAPVPKFAETIGKPTASFLEMIPKDKPVWRINWTLHDSYDLFCPEAHESKKNLTVDNVLNETHIRVERQTLRRLPNTEYILFSIRTYIYSVAEAIEDAKRKDILIRTLDGLPEDVAFYKGMRKFFPVLKEALKK